MATRKPEDTKAVAKPAEEKRMEDAALESEAKVIRESVQREEDRKQAKIDALPDDLIEGQQTGGTHDTVTKADAHVEPTRAEVLNPDAPQDKVVGGHDATNDRVEYASKAELEIPAKTEDLGLEGLDLFIREAEDKAQLQGAVVVEISHPDATEGIYEGRDAGIRMVKGSKKVTYSDGTTK